TSLKETLLRADLQNRRFELLRSMSLGMMEDLDTDSLLERILRSAVEFAGSGNGVISLLEQKGTLLRHRCAVGLQESMVGEARPATVGMTGQALRERRRLFAKDYRTLEGRIADPRFDSITTNIVLPLFSGPHDFGAVSIHFTDECPDLDESFFTSLDQFASVASMALENARLHEASQREIREKIRAEERLLAHGRLAAASAEASGYLLSQDHAGTALGRALGSLAEAAGAERAVLFRNLADEGKGAFSEAATGGGEGGALVTGKDGLVRKEVFPLLFDQLASGQTFLGSLKEGGSGEKGIAAVPVFLRSRFWGFLALFFPGKEPLSSAGELDVLRTAACNMAASMVRWEADNKVKEGYERLQKTFDEVIRTMGFIVGRKDPYTIEHQERVAVLAREIGTVMGLDPWRLEG
ncbi:MAG: GAF domain-containing protein, partial [Synergistales bacterium]|nr:GAF domain-containing protein [Synergistales bacterium]